MNNRFIIISHIPIGGIYFIEKVAKIGCLDSVIVQISKGSIIKSFIKKILLRNKTKKGKQDLSLYLNDFNNSHLVGAGFESKLIHLSKIYKFKIMITCDINNDVNVKNHFKKIRNKYQFVLGGKVLKKELLECANGIWINGHGGVLPYYRGLCSEYWAIKNNDYDNIGCTIHMLTEKIDCGHIIKISKIRYTQEETLEDCMLRNHSNLIKTYLNVIDDLTKNSIDLPCKSEPQKGNYYSIPRNINFEKLKNIKVKYL